MVLFPVIDDKARTRHRIEEAAVGAPQIDKEILDLDAPIVEEGVLDACTDCIADAGVIVGVGREGGWQAAAGAYERVAPFIVVAAESNTACAVGFLLLCKRISSTAKQTGNRIKITNMIFTLNAIWYSSFQFNQFPRLARRSKEDKVDPYRVAKGLGHTNIAFWRA